MQKAKQRPASPVQACTRHPFMQQAGRFPKWTVSTRKKMPVDIQKYARTGKIDGAVFPENHCTDTLENVLKIMPNAGNAAFFLDCFQDGFMILDIEPKCPPERKAKLLSLPYIYGEVSMSGNGYHLVFPIPENVDDFEEAKQKTVLRSPKKDYEILMNHWVTFTGRMIPPCDKPAASFETLYAFLAENAKKHDYSCEIPYANKKPIPNEKELTKALIARWPYMKETLASCDNDKHIYDYAVVMFFTRQLENLMKSNPMFIFSSLDETDKIWLVYNAVESKVGHRNEEKGIRCGAPYLFYTVCRHFARLKNEAKEKQEKDQAKSKDGPQNSETD